MSRIGHLIIACFCLLTVLSIAHWDHSRHSMSTAGEVSEEYLMAYRGHGHYGHHHYHRGYYGHNYHHWGAHEWAFHHHYWYGGGFWGAHPGYFFDPNFYYSVHTVPAVAPIVQQAPTIIIPQSTTPAPATPASDAPSEK